MIRIHVNYPPKQLKKKVDRISKQLGIPKREVVIDALRVGLSILYKEIINY